MHNSHSVSIYEPLPPRCAHMLNHLSRVWLFYPIDCSLPGSSVHGILQARTLEWVAIFFSRASSRPRDCTRVFYISCIGRFFTTSATREALLGTSHLLWEEGSIGNSFICLLHRREGRHRKIVACLRLYRAGTTTTKHFLSAQYMSGTVLSAGHSPTGLENSSCQYSFHCPNCLHPLLRLIPAFLCGVDASLAKGLTSWLGEGPVAGNPGVLWKNRIWLLSPALAHHTSWPAAAGEGAGSSKHGPLINFSSSINKWIKARSACSAAMPPLGLVTHRSWDIKLRTSSHTLSNFLAW